MSPSTPTQGPATETRVSHRPSATRTLVLGLPDDRFRAVSWHHGTKMRMARRFTALRVRSTNRNLPREANRTLPAYRLLAKWPDGAAEPTD